MQRRPGSIACDYPEHYRALPDTPGTGAATCGERTYRAFGSGKALKDGCSACAAVWVAEGVCSNAKEEFGRVRVACAKGELPAP